jgi:hypothetical protein
VPQVPAVGSTQHGLIAGMPGNAGIIEVQVAVPH